MTNKKNLGVKFYTKQLEIIPRSWTLCDNAQCYWPYAGDVKKLAEKCIAPDPHKWSIWKIQQVVVESGKCHCIFLVLYTRRNNTSCIKYEGCQHYFTTLFNNVVHYFAHYYDRATLKMTDARAETTSSESEQSTSKGATSGLPPTLLCIGG